MSATARSLDDRHARRSRHRRRRRACRSSSRRIGRFAADVSLEIGVDLGRLLVAMRHLEREQPVDDRLQVQRAVGRQRRARRVAGDRVYS